MCIRDSTLFFDHPTPAAVGKFLQDRLLNGDRNSSEAVLSTIDQLAEELTATAGDTALRLRVEMRLRGLLDGLGAEERNEKTETGVDLESASADEVFRFIDELGVG